MSVKLVVDCSANICENVTENISYVPLKICTTEKEYVDVPQMDVAGMIKDLKAYKGKSTTACPSTMEWLDAFGDNDIVLGASITSGLSGCYNSALIAVDEFKEKYPDKNIFILDSLSTGPELELLMEKYDELIKKGLSFEEIVESIKEYSKRTHLAFSLESLDNFAKNGRVSPILAKAIGIVGIRIVGIASTEGTLEPVHKCRGFGKALDSVLSVMEEQGYKGGKVRISHSYNEEGAKTMAEIIKAKYPECDLHITINRGLCCFYAEEGSVLVGFES